MPNWKSAVATSALFVYTFTLAPGALSQQPDKQEAAAAADRGKAAFSQSCGFCHGPDATGARGPDLVRSSLVAHDVKGDLIGPVVREGRPDKGMPPLPLTPEQIADVATFLHARAKEALESSGVPNTYPVEKLLTGNTDKGKAFFEGAGGCKNCHSPTGDLAGVAKKYPPIELQAHMLYPDDKEVPATVTLPTGEQVSGMLAHLDDFVVGLRVGDKTGWYRSFRRKDVKLEIKDPLTAHRELLPKLASADIHNLFAYINTLK
ncbi:MAG: c-type cytochrome [Acidobacteria bacterium]|nr:c-type cytochrome [Acidobacteriota bacterium]MBS1866634.1 c-type cytochrome [Acidobacteriota bacterium]